MNRRHDYLPPALVEDDATAVAAVCVLVVVFVVGVVVGAVLL